MCYYNKTQDLYIPYDNFESMTYSGKCLHLECMKHLFSRSIESLSLFFSKGSGRPSLFIREGTMIPGVEHIIKLYTNTPGSGVTVNTEHFLSNKPPYGGDCSVSPLEGESLCTPVSSSVSMVIDILFPQDLLLTLISLYYVSNGGNGEVKVSSSMSIELSNLVLNDHCSSILVMMLVHHPP